MTTSSSCVSTLGSGGDSNSCVGLAVNPFGSEPLELEGVSTLGSGGDSNSCVGLAVNPFGSEPLELEGVSTLGSGGDSNSCGSSSITIDEFGKSPR